MVMNLPNIDTDYLLNFLTGLLNTPSPTGLAMPGIEFTERALGAFPALSLNRTRKGALLATWPGQKADTPHAKQDLPLVRKNRASTLVVNPQAGLGRIQRLVAVAVRPPQARLGQVELQDMGALSLRQGAAQPACG